MGSGSSVIEEESTGTSNEERKCSHGYTCSHTIETDRSWWCSGGYTTPKIATGEYEEHRCSHGQLCGHKVEQKSSEYCYGPL